MQDRASLVQRLLRVAALAVVRTLGPYARLRALGEGDGESRFGAASSREINSCGSEQRADHHGSGELHRGHQ